MYKDIELVISIDLRHLMRFKRGVNIRRERLFEEAGNRFVEYLRNRFIALAAGGGRWSPLEETTVKRKEQRKKKYNTSAQARWILRETNQLLNNIECVPNKNGFKVGYWSQDIHARPGEISTITVTQLAVIHHYGIGQKARPIIVRPNTDTLGSMKQAIQKAFGKVINETRV